MGDLPQSKRLEIIENLKSGRLSILVATDVAARGLDVEALDLVVNYDLPDDQESYVHRIGRTARAGKSGKAVSFACEKFVFNLPDIEKFIGMKIPVAAWDPGLLAEDRSEGMRFGRSARDLRPRGGEGGRDTRRDGRGTQRQGLGRDRGGRDYSRERDREAPRPREEVKRPDDPRVSGKPRAEVHGQAKARREASPAEGQSQARPQKKPQVAASPSKRPLSSSDPDLQKLSQEERLRLFKEKYGVTPPMPGQKKAPEGAGGKARGQSPRGRVAAQSVGGQAPSGKAVPAKSPAPKPGIFQRILGIFGKKS